MSSPSWAPRKDIDMLTRTERRHWSLSLPKVPLSQCAGCHPQTYTDCENCWSNNIAPHWTRFIICQVGCLLVNLKRRRWSPIWAFNRMFGTGVSGIFGHLWASSWRGQSLITKSRFALPVGAPTLLEDSRKESQLSQPSRLICPSGKRRDLDFFGGIFLGLGRP